VTRELISIALLAICAGALLFSFRAFSRVAAHVTWAKLPQFVLNRFLPNAADRDTNFDYVDRRAWADLSSAQMWLQLAGLSMIGAIIARLL
jgi:hypothetical protein